jgi:hypothetical protein
MGIGQKASPDRGHITCAQFGSGLGIVLFETVDNSFSPWSKNSNSVKIKNK